MMASRREGSSVQSKQRRQCSACFLQEWAGAIKQPLTELGPEMTDYDFYGVGLHACLKELASGLEDDQHLAETLARILAKEPKSPDPNPGSDALLGCITAACNAFLSLPIPVRVLPE